MVRPVILIALTILLSLHDVNGIIGGKLVPSGQFKYMAAVYVDDQFKCGGGILSPEYVITAAVCVSGINPSRIKVTVGQVKLSNSPAGRLSVSEVVIHKDYYAVIPAGARKPNAFALLKMVNRLKSAPTIDSFPGLPKRVICYTCPHDIAGWGFPDWVNRRQSEDLKTGTIYLLENFVMEGISLAANEVWAHNNKEATGPASGDIGSPVMIDGVLFGILLGNTNGDTYLDKAIILRLFPYMDYINGIVRGTQSPTTTEKSRKRKL